MKDRCKKTLAYLYGLERFGVKKGLSRTRRLLGALGNPQNRFMSVHVAGTNGKGSVSAMLASVLAEAGFKTGLYTSPHLIRFNERIRVNNAPITDDAIAALALTIKKTPGAYGATFFEFTTGLAFRYFLEKGVEIAVIETGMGGRWDATNLITPLVSVITNVEMDHARLLGGTIEKIACEKAGIIKKGIPVVTAERKKNALSIIRKEASRKGSPIFVLGKDFTASRSSTGRFALDYRSRHGQLNAVELSLQGDHQLTNASCVLTAIELLKDKGLAIPRSAVRAGLKRTSWPGRFETIAERPRIILDAAHNPAGAKALASALARLDSKRVILVLGCMADKDVSGILDALAPVVDMIIVTRPETDRAETTSGLKTKASKTGKPVIVADGVKDACRVAVQTASPDDAVCVAGSLFTVAEAMRYFKRRDGMN